MERRQDGKNDQRNALSSAVSAVVLGRGQRTPSETSFPHRWSALPLSTAQLRSIVSRRKSLKGTAAASRPSAFSARPSRGSILTANEPNAQSLDPKHVACRRTVSLPQLTVDTLAPFAYGLLLSRRHLRLASGAPRLLPILLVPVSLIVGRMSSTPIVRASGFFSPACKPNLNLVLSSWFLRRSGVGGPRRWSAVVRIIRLGTEAGLAGLEITAAACGPIAWCCRGVSVSRLQAAPDAAS